MYINVIYPSIISNQWLIKKSKRFFAGTDYRYRNNVFAHPELDSVFFFEKNRLHIRIPCGDVGAQRFVNHFLRVLFNKTMIGINGSDADNSIVLNAINHVGI